MLKLDNVTISYKNVPTVQNFNLDMKEGQIVSLVGESGSGKTTVIRAVLGLLAGGGKVIQDICATCNCKIDVQEDGHVFVSAVDQEDAKRAIFTIKTIVEDPEIGAIYKGKVTRLMNFGAFVEIAPGKEGLVHISKLDTKRVERVEDVVAVGDAIVVKVTDIDQQGRINLSRRDAILALEAKKAQQEQG